MDELTKAQKIEQKRQARLKELLTIFHRAYEMSRAWGKHQQIAEKIARGEVENFLRNTMKLTPQENSFILSYARDFRELIPNIIKQIESNHVK